MFSIPSAVGLVMGIGNGIFNVRKDRIAYTAQAGTVYTDEGVHA